ncbi:MULTISPECIES: type III pantothenate kinase [Pseudonocardia]|uniref:Type III pantothenate kinase n=2 Tax=Pseudonocardia TaxID=1847 RepID=A0A1Y2MX79_PSEAH|nr:MULTISPECIES: type III pantothenate kinase [Pseudonocardia]OSY39800.1 Type III pantothenate kinase [Pseudonocardia autotrophica]TDN74396.1 type III pantothenate kinase [Pseudonocardia autotrophica]BBG05163.1 type III pantothenate kinase [Pseudonocardia autotrophica]GEC28118.1 type III pantothenate kinase [Pseudonocardia saturnea]
MLLCIDVGNTHVSLGLYPEPEPGTDPSSLSPEPEHRWRMRTDTGATADELDLTITGMLGPRFAAVTAVAALSTVPGPSRELRTLLSRWSDRMRTLVVGPGVRTGVPLLVDHPREVGADRVVNSLAAHHLFGTTCICVDLGTCTNIDVVSARGEFLGGALAPGIDIAMQALAERASSLRPVDLVEPRSVIGRTTVEAVQAGVLYGAAGQVDGLVRRILAELGGSAQPVTVAVTGGLAELVYGRADTITEHVPDLTLHGLRLTHLRHHRPAR